MAFRTLWFGVKKGVGGGEGTGGEGLEQPAEERAR